VIGRTCSAQGRDGNAYSTLVGKLSIRHSSEELDIGTRIILERILNKHGGKVWTGFIWLRIGTSGGLL
jgi:hypothetical protein